MIFRVVVTLLLLALILYALLQRREFPLVNRVTPFVALGGIYIVWFPESTSEAAAWVGIGRGVDLMLYIWILASGLLILVLHLKLVTHERRMTELARFVALQTVCKPESGNAPVPDSRPPASNDAGRIA